MVNADGPALAALHRADASLLEVMNALGELDRSNGSFRNLKVGIAANITVDLLSTYLRRHAYLSGVRLDVAKGSYDDWLGDVKAHQAAGVDLLLLLPFFDNLQPSWEAQLENLDLKARQAILDDCLARLELALQAAAGIGQILLMGPHLSNPQVRFDSSQQQTLEAFNAGLAELAKRYATVRFLDTAGLFSSYGAKHALDARFYFRGKAPYSAGFIDQLAKLVRVTTRSFGGAFHKVLVLDCDNTLWGGIVGEDGVHGIKLDPYSYPGNIFWSVQQQFRALESQGVLLCLCSKNNAADVVEVLEKHPSMPLRATYVVAQKINWDDKPSNLRALAADLKLGLESFVFVDDSSFEIEAVREQLPQVTVFQVPKVLHDYPELVREQIVPLFLGGTVSAESRSKTRQYRDLEAAAQLQATFSSQDEYLRSLGLVVTVQRNARSQVERIAELMAKSNQFNLTTRRMTLGELLALMDSDDAAVYAFTVSDRLADHGLTGILIATIDGDAMVVQSFLLSCRIIGRGVEFAIWRAVVADALAKGMHQLKAVYHPTAKNAMVADFYDRLGLSKTNETEDGSRYYEAQLANLRLAQSEWVELRNGG